MSEKVTNVCFLARKRGFRYMKLLITLLVEDGSCDVRYLSWFSSAVKDGPIFNGIKSRDGNTKTLIWTHPRPLSRISMLRRMIVDSGFAVVHYSSSKHTNSR